MRLLTVHSVFLCEYNTEEEIDYIIEELPKIVSMLRDMSPVWERIMEGEDYYAVQ